ncbi:MAG: benzoate-CoA ligase family protein [Proteobacteria bacterium]|nr:benzoate-CoA ligase family protein [Pseudomonadota bacterium]
MSIDWTDLLGRDRINLADCLVQRHVREGHGARRALLHGHRTCSYAELAADIARSARVLRERGMRRGDRVLLAVPDSPAFVVAFFAVLSGGGVAVLTNPLLPAADIAYQARHLGARLAVAYHGVLDKLAELRDDGVAVVSCGDGDADRGEFERAAATQPTQFDCEPTAAADLAYVLFSSGTTGRPKAIPRRHRDILHCARAFGDEILGLRSDDVTLAVPKLTFGYALGGSLLFSFVAGAAAVVFPARSTATSVAEQLNRHRPSIFLGTPRIIAELLKTRQTDGLGRLRIATSAGEALPPSVLAHWGGLIAAPLVDGFGSTEAGHIFLSNAPLDVRPGTCGRSLSGFRTKLIDATGQEVGAGQTGRMCIAGPSVASEYLNDPHRSAECYDGEWHISSDLFSCQDGVYTYVGRADDMVKRGCGEWVSPYEVEDELLKLPTVLECAVVGSHTPGGTIGLKAYVVASRDTPAGQRLANALIEHTRLRWPDFPHKHLDDIEFLEALPRNTSGKIQRQLLRQQTLTEFSYDC